MITLGGQHGWISAEAVTQPFERRVDKNEVLPFRETLLIPAQLASYRVLRRPLHPDYLAILLGRGPLVGQRVQLDKPFP